MEFDRIDVPSQLQAMGDDDLDRLPFGVIRLDAAGRVLAFNRYEADAAGLPRERVLGRPFFAEVAPCMDNALVAGRFSTGEAVDEQMDYVFTLRMRPESVRLRLISDPANAVRYLLVLRHGTAR